MDNIITRYEAHCVPFVRLPKSLLICILKEYRVTEVSTLIWFSLPLSTVFLRPYPYK